MKFSSRAMLYGALLFAGAVAMVGLTVITAGQEVPGQAAAWVDDWTHHHLVFSNPGTEADAIKNRRYERWYNITHDPRYQMQQLKRSHAQRTADPTTAAAPTDFMSRLAAAMAATPTPIPKPKRNPIKQDWMVGLGSGTAATATSSFSGEPASSSTLTITGLGNTLKLQATSGSGSSSCSFSGGSATVHFQRNGTASTDAAELVSLINISGCGSTVGVTASNPNPPSTTVRITAATAGTGGNSISVVASSSTFDLFSTTATNLSGGTTATVQPNAYPAKYGVSLTSASCSDFVIYPTGQAGGTSAADMVAYDNLYATGTGAPCSGGPSVDWAYNTGGTVTTSPVLSEDGSQVAFMQVSGTTASLVLLKWAASTTESIGSPMTLTSQSASNYRSCTAPCMYSVALSGAENDTLSAPYADYTDDTIYVGDDSGNLHQFTGVFNGTPAEITASPWPVHVSSNKLSSPVYDTEYGFQGGYVFVGDMGGVFYSVCGPNGYQCTNSGQIHGNTGSLGDAIADAPLVDASEGIEFVFVTTNGSYSWTGYNGVWEFVSIFTDLGTPGIVPVGCGASTACGGTAGGYYLYAGALDNVYFESGNPAYGHLYVAGNTGVAGGATLYQVGIAYSSLTGTVNTVASGLNITQHAWPSPVTEFCNNNANACAITSQRSVTGKVSTTSPEITILNGSGTFTSADVGAVVTGTDIPFGDTISSVVSATTANLTAAPTAAVSSESLAIQGGQTTSGSDYVFFSVNSPASGLCSYNGTGYSGPGNGCVLSYNVSNPTSVTRSGTGLPMMDPATNGCWATGAIIIDNMSTTPGASQIYFVSLAGAAAGGGANGGTPTSSNCTAGAGPTIAAEQASQASP